MVKERPDLKPYLGQKLTVIAWLWARTVKSPNPAFANVDVPLASTFMLSTKPGKEAYVEPILGARASRPQQEWHSRGYLPHWEAGERPQSLVFRLHDSLPQTLLDQWREELSRLPETEAQLERRKRIEAALDAGHGECLLGDPRIGKLVEEALLHFDQQRNCLHAWVIMPNHVHVLVTPLHGSSLSSLVHSWKSFTAKEANKLLGRTGAFWLEEYFDRAIRDEGHFHGAVEYIEHNPVKAGLCARPEDWILSSALGARSSRAQGERAGRPRSQDEIPLAEGGTGARAYAEAVGVYLGFAIDKCTDYWNSIATWMPRGTVGHLFARHAVPMTWDFPEANPFSEFHCAWHEAFEWVSKSIETLPASGTGNGKHEDASVQSVSSSKVVSTDPPYYDNIGYADLSDYFYVWLRRALRPVFPDLFATMAVPKAEELVATPYRHGGKEKAETFFLDGMTQAMHRLAEQAHPAYPVTIYYAFKQSESSDAEGTTNTGWDTFLAAVIEAGFAISGTWPMRTERGARSIGIGTNALASSIILVCRPRAANAPTATRREFLNALKSELPDALAQLQAANIAPVDLAQAAIGPGMAVYTRFSKVLDAEGKPIPVRAALALINQVLDEVLAEQEGDFDADSRFALAWFEQQGFAEGEFGVADVLARAKGTAVEGVAEAGIIVSGRGKVRILKPEELPKDWDPFTDKRLTVWEMVHQLIRVLESGGEAPAAALAAKLGTRAETARELCYRLYSLCERKKRATEAMAYNALVQSWPEISRLAQEIAHQAPSQGQLAL